MAEPGYVDVWTYPHDELAKKARFFGGLDVLLEGAAETAGVNFDKPETVPPPLRALRRAFRVLGAFALVIEVPNKAGELERWRVEVTAAPAKLALVKGGKK